MQRLFLCLSLAAFSVAGGLAAQEPQDPQDSSSWFYASPQRPTVPQPQEDASSALRNSEGWVRNPIDAFVLQGLQAAGLEPSQPAQRAAWLRRVTYDLTGLPPTPEEREAFEMDDSEEAYERVVERLLASPHYGEKQARHWLDVVRYAETNGYERDSDKPYMWRYRDWVIEAFNSGMPYNEFVQHQLAGDEIENPTPESITATGYYRLPIWDDEPGAGALQGKYDVLADIVSTTGSAFLGMSVGCARCHDHKVDPIKTKDFYSLMGFFHGLTNMSTQGILRDVMTEAEREEFERASAEKRSRVEEHRAGLRPIEERFARAWSKGQGEALRQPDLVGLRYAFYRDTWESLPDFDSILAEDEGTLPDGLLDLAPASREKAFGFVFEGELQVQCEGQVRFRLRSDDGSRLIVGDETVLDHDGLQTRRAQAQGVVALSAGSHPLRLEYFDADGGPRLELWWESVEDNTWQYRFDPPTDETNWTQSLVLVEGWQTGPAGFGTASTPGSQVGTEWNSPRIWIRQGFEWSAEDEDPVCVLHHDDRANLYVDGQLAVEVQGYTRDYQVFELPGEVRESLTPGKHVLALEVASDAGGQYGHARIVPRSALRNLHPADAAFARRPLSQDAALRRGVNLADLIRGEGHHYLSPEDLHAWSEGRIQLEREERRAIPRKRAPAAQEKLPIPAMFVHQRGSAAALGEEAPLAFPSPLAEAMGHPVPEITEAPDGTSGRRLALARWMTRPDHPATARVMVNRLWQAHFGRGLVRTPNEFGGLGEAPTNRDLLDWLAVEFVESGWDVRHMHRLMLLSSTYRMSSQPREEGLATDPRNDLYWRFDPRRLSAEELRDSLLVLTDRIRRQIGGPSFFEPMPAEVLATSSTPHAVWGKSSDEDIQRRSIYIKVKRSLIHPVLQAFDLADTDQSCPVRFTTTTPLQALSMLNGEFIARHAQAFAERLAAHSENLEEQLEFGLGLALGRPANEREVKELADLARELVASGEVDDRGALVDTCLVILNLNEFLYLD